MAVKQELHCDSLQANSRGSKFVYSRFLPLPPSGPNPTWYRSQHLRSSFDRIPDPRR
jgi:hypothetical protein